jgi:hypothetical protein
MSETVILEAIKTTVVAIPKPIPLIRVVVIAKVGQRPKSWTKLVLFFQRPSWIICV